LTRHDHATTRGRQRPWGAALVAFLTVLSALVATVTWTAAAQAVNNDGTSPFATYNMHGSDNGLAWRAEIQRLVATNAVVALQEAGSGPPIPADPHRSNYHAIRLTPNRAPFPSSVIQTVWQGGPGGSDRFVYFLQTDPRRVGDTGQDTWDGGQMNLATVTDSRADEVRVLENPDYNPDPDAPGNRYRARPLLGLRFGNTWYWNTHARGHDVDGLLDQVRNFAATDHRNWVLVGDFNRNILNRSDRRAHDETLHLRNDETLLRTGQPTFVNGDNPSELDYAVTHGLTGFTATRPNGAGSDHVPVLFGRTPPPAQAPVPAHAYGTVLAAPTGRVLQENADRTITIGDERDDNNQTFRMYTTDALTHYLQNIGTGDCVAIAPDARRAVSSGVVAGKCDDPRAQWTISHLEDDPLSVNDDNGGPQRWQNVAVPGLCLTPGTTSVTVAACTENAAQRWWDNPSNNVGWSTGSRDFRLESSFLGGRLRRSDISSKARITTEPTPPWYWWWYWLLGGERRDFGWSVERPFQDQSDNVVRFTPVYLNAWCLAAKDGHAGKQTDAALRVCREAANDAGQTKTWLAESYADGSIRFRNEANHLCLLSPDGDHGDVTLHTCQDIPAERWNVVNP
jgi:endonuclease/exonuclease/phosphatase family metal-dependent hydrolase